MEFRNSTSKKADKPLDPLPLTPRGLPYQRKSVNCAMMDPHRKWRHFLTNGNNNWLKGSSFRRSVKEDEVFNVWRRRFEEKPPERYNEKEKEDLLITPLSDRLGETSPTRRTCRGGSKTAMNGREKGGEKPLGHRQKRTQCKERETDEWWI